MGGETDQYHPELVDDNHPTEPPRTPEEGYHLTEDLADHAIRYLADLRGASPSTPFLLWFAPGACHAPHQAPAGYIERYRGALRQGMGPVERGGVRPPVGLGPLARGNPALRAPLVGPGLGHACSADEQRLAARLMEVFAGFLTHTDAQVARVLDFIDAARRDRQHHRHRHERQRRIGRGRGARDRSTSSTSSTSSPRAWRRTSNGSTTSARPGPTTTTRGAGPGPATRPSSDSSAIPMKAGWPTRSSSTGRPASGRRAARAISTSTPSMSCRRCSNSSGSTRPDPSPASSSRRSRG